MRYETSAAFRAAPNKRITLMGMSNVGKTALSTLLPRDRWFVYAADYRIAKAGLRDQILDMVRTEMMASPLLAELLHGDRIDIELKAGFRDLGILGMYLGKLGDAARGGLPAAEFRRRQTCHRLAEISAMQDIRTFVARGRDLFGYPHFICDSSESLCEVIDPLASADPTLKAITGQTLLVYIAADEAHQQSLVEKAARYPKPLYYRPEFLEPCLAEYLDRLGIPETAIDPDAFLAWIYPKLLRARRPRYEAIARSGVTINGCDARSIRDETDLLCLVGDAIDRASTRKAGP